MTWIKQNKKLNLIKEIFNYSVTADDVEINLLHC